MIKKAIIPAAGLGTRFLPATKAMPKEMLPIIDKPTIQYIVEEAIESGIEDIIIVTGKGKRAIEDHFDHSFELENNLLQKQRLDLLQEVQKSSQVDIHYIRQKEPKGLGHAIWCARSFIGKEPFAVLLGDIIVKSSKPCLKQLMELHHFYKTSIIGVRAVEQAQLQKYGIIDPEKITEHIYRVKQLVEKPRIEDAPSNLAIAGRYILSAKIFELLEDQAPDAGGEIQLTDAIAALNQQEAIYAYSIEGNWYDVGEKLSYLKAVIELSLERKEFQMDLIEYLNSLINKR